MAQIDTQFRRIMVGDSPFCYWDLNIVRQTSTFLESIDPKYFESMSNALFPYILDPRKEEDFPLRDKFIAKLIRYLRRKEYLPDINAQHAAIALRMIYSQSLETMFALICGAVQAPRCIHAWMLKYRPSDVRDLLRKIESGQAFPWMLRVRTPSWYVISDFILSNLVLEDKDKEEKIKQGFAGFWSRLASDFVKESFTQEYNSIKHGLRVLSGGFSVAIGRQDARGIPAPRERMKELGRSEFGSTFITAEQIGEHHQHFQSLHSSRNWSPIDLAWALQLVTMSLTNVIGFLRIQNGTPAEEVRFEWPDDFNVFDEPWKRSIRMGVTAMTGFGNKLHPSLIEPFSREDIRSEYSKGNDGGVIRRKFEEDSDGEGSS